MAAKPLAVINAGVKPINNWSTALHHYPHHLQSELPQGYYTETGRKCKHISTKLLSNASKAQSCSGCFKSAMALCHECDCFLLFLLWMRIESPNETYLAHNVGGMLKVESQNAAGGNYVTANAQYFRHTEFNKLWRVQLNTQHPFKMCFYF